MQSLGYFSKRSVLRNEKTVLEGDMRIKADLNKAGEEERESGRRRRAYLEKTGEEKRIQSRQESNSELRLGGGKVGRSCKVSTENR